MAQVVPVSGKSADDRPRVGDEPIRQRRERGLRAGNPLPSMSIPRSPASTNPTPPGVTGTIASQTVEAYTMSTTAGFTRAPTAISAVISTA